MTLLRRLVQRRAILCPRCRAAFDTPASDGGELRCGACGAAYPVRHGTVDLFTGYRGRGGEAPLPDRATLSSLARALEQPPTEATFAVLADIWRGVSRRASQTHHSAEIAEVLDRFGLGGPEAPAPAPVRNEAPLTLEASCERHYLEAALPADQPLFRNVRVRNTGEDTWSSEGKRATGLSYRWMYPSGGYALPAGPITPFPIPIEPGRAITLPMELRTPARPGEYVLRVLVEQRSQRRDFAPFAFLGRAIADLRVLVGSGSPPADLQAIRLSDQGYDYAEDHERGRAR